MKVDKHKVAWALADALENYVEQDTWGSLIAGLELNRYEKAYAKTFMRWTIVNERTGENLLEPTLNTTANELLAVLKDALEYFEANRDDLYCRIRSRRIKLAIAKAKP